MAQTDYYVRRVLDAVFNGVPFSVGTAYVGLGVSDGSGGIVELTYSDYSRKPVVWNTAIDGSIDSAQQIVWTATSSWGTVTQAFLSDAAQGGNMLFTTSIGNVTVGSGSQVYVDPGDLYVT
jgi:hypothetical protein